MDVRNEDTRPAAASLIMWIATAIAVAAVILWLTGFIAPPAGIAAGAAAIIVILASAGRLRRSA
jgi:hypothetical protein